LGRKTSKEAGDEKNINRILLATSIKKLPAAEPDAAAFARVADQVIGIVWVNVSGFFAANEHQTGPGKVLDLSEIFRMQCSKTMEGMHPKNTKFWQYRAG
jgi:hypothetical protein